MSQASLASDENLIPDPLFVRSCKEGTWVLLMWVACFVWTLAVCLTLGYPTEVDPETFPTVFGLPAWVAWGVGLPWLVADVVTIWFCLTQMEDADLGGDPATSDNPENTNVAAVSSENTNV